MFLVKNIPDEVRSNYSEIPWKNIAGMRDKLVHEYWAIDAQIVWQVVQQNIPLLKVTITNIVERLPENN